MTPLTAWLAFALVTVGQSGRPPSSDTLSFISVASSGSTPQGFACGIRFGPRRVLGDDGGARFMELSRTAPDKAELMTFAGSVDSSIGKGVRRRLDVRVDEAADRCQVTFTERDSTPFARGRLLNLWKAPPDRTAQVLEDTAVFRVRLEYTSPYPASALLANFDRRGVRECVDVGVSSRLNLVADSLKTSSNLYCIRVKERQVPTQIDCHPYRQGSRCTIDAVVTPVRTAAGWDARPMADALATALKAIVND